MGNIVGNEEGIKLGCEFRNDADTKITRGSMYSLVVGNQGDLTFGEGRYFDDPTKPFGMYSPLRDVVVEKHIGNFARWLDQKGEPHATITVGADGKLPVSQLWRGRMRFYDRDTITIKDTTSRVLDAAPTLNTTVCGPGSTRGKVWGT
jgi:hypothetical protein